mmetsp:Transcript_9632/g.19673  ORF Transcript_9632/g.19673 Transcript_9632/m.19673 type:complete len:266 (+) Transcript_9632:884-1681(+)
MLHHRAHLPFVAWTTDVAILSTEVPHIINNAYGIQSRRCCGLIDAACREGRVDFVVQSLDKNFLVPVGGAAILAQDSTLIDEVCRVYPGRASGTPALDLMITLLDMGRTEFKRLLDMREELFPYMRDTIHRVATKHGERLLNTPGNPISISMSLTVTTPTSTPTSSAYPSGLASPTALGSMLFSRGISGARVVHPIPDTITTIGTTHFSGGFGPHCPNYPTSYLTAACALGMTQHDIDEFAHRLDQTLTDWKQHQNQNSSIHTYP